MFDFITVVNDRMVLALMKKAMSRSAWDMYFRPFTTGVWVMIFITMGIVAIILIGLPFFGKLFVIDKRTLKKVTRLIAFVSWSCYLVVEIYFEGALTMFFTTKIGVPFNSIREAMRAFPEWRLLMRSGYEAYYTQYVEAGDKDYIGFWDRVQENPDENTFTSVGEVIDNRSKDPVIIHDVEGAISTYQGDASLYLDVFEKGRTEWYGLIVTENSPLGPMLQHGAKILHERGVFDYLKTRWLGGVDHCRPLIDMESSNMVLGLEHVCIIFVVLACLMFLSFMMFLVEIYKNSQNRISMKLKKARYKKKEKICSSPKKEKKLDLDVEDDKINKSSLFNLIWNI